MLFAKDCAVITKNGKYYSLILTKEKPKTILKERSNRARVIYWNDYEKMYEWLRNHKESYSCIIELTD